jgi:DNA-binding Lrp family transcriptional regulator
MYNFHTYMFKNVIESYKKHHWLVLYQHLFISPVQLYMYHTGCLMFIDNLDKKIIQHLSKGTNSYQELAKLCNITRNTVYRRINSLEHRGIIKNTLGYTINLDQLDITPIIFGAKVPTIDMDRTFNLLAAHKNVRLLWRTYGDHNTTLIAYCPRGEEGEVIQSIKAIFESVNVINVDVSTGFVWEKMEFAPYGGYDIEFEAKRVDIIEKRV